MHCKSSTIETNLSTILLSFSSVQNSGAKSQTNQSPYIFHKIIIICLAPVSSGPPLSKSGDQVTVSFLLSLSAYQNSKLQDNGISNFV